MSEVLKVHSPERNSGMLCLMVPGMIGENDEVCEAAKNAWGPALVFDLSVHGCIGQSSP